MLPGGLVMGLLGPVVGRLYDRIGARRLIIPGALVLAAVLWVFTTLGASSPLWEIVALHVVLVIGLSLMFTPLMTDALGQLPGDLDSHGSAIMATLQQVAGAAGTALFITVMTLFATDPHGGRRRHRHPGRVHLRRDHRHGRAAAHPAGRAAHAPVRAQPR